MNKNKLSLLAILSLVLVVTYCDSNYFGRLLTRNAGNTPDKTNVTPIPVPPGGDSSKQYFSVTNSWTQTNQTSSVAAEIVFVLDRSGSMDDNVVRLTKSLTGWMATLDTLGLPNYCVDLMSAVADTNAGKLQGTGGEKCFCRYDSNGTELNTVAQIKTKFEAAISTAVGATGADSNGESGIYSIHKALSDAAVLSSNQQAGCFRNDMALAVVLMSDEQEMMFAQDGTSCTGNGTTSAGGTVALNTVKFDNSLSFYGQSGFQNSDPTADNYTGSSYQCSEVRERLTKYSEATPTGPGGTYKLVVTPQSVADELLDYNTNLPSYLNSIVYPKGANPAFGSSSEGPGHGYFEITDIFGQTPIDLSLTNSDTTQSQFNTKMNALATDLVTQLSFTRVFSLSDPVCATELDSLVVKKNGVALPSSKYTLNTAHNKVTIVPSVVFHVGDAVAINFTKCTN